MNNLKQLAYSFITMTLSMLLICWIVSLAQMKETEKKHYVSIITKTFKINY